jgi:cellulose synthase/poly-beta-1,6-N-acetylglucosamine synthase-like glycosyltransferase
MTVGNLVRHLWNVATTSIMYHLKMPWGGCYGIRMSAIREGSLVEKWAKVAALDMHTTGEMKDLGLTVHFVPSLMMVNREESPLPAATNWIRRQLTWARLYNPGWWLLIPVRPLWRWRVRWRLCPLHSSLGQLRRSCGQRLGSLLIYSA